MRFLFIAKVLESIGKGSKSRESTGMVFFMLLFCAFCVFRSFLFLALFVEKVAGSLRNLLLFSSESITVF